MKGCNMSFRASFISDIYFDEKLRGLGDIYCNDLDFCLQVKRRGGLIIYDTQVGLDHYVRTRLTFELNKRDGVSFNFLGEQNAAYNFLYAFKKNYGWSTFLKVGMFKNIHGFLTFHKLHWLKRVAVNASAFCIVLFKKCDS